MKTDVKQEKMGMGVGEVGNHCHQKPVRIRQAAAARLAPRIMEEAAQHSRHSHLNTRYFRNNFLSLNNVSNARLAALAKVTFS